MIALIASACATVRPDAGPSIDVQLEGGAHAALSQYRGKVVVLDVCASWAAACNLNARVLDEVASVLEADPVVVVTVLLDEGAMAKEAVRGYRETLGVKHAVMLAGPRVRSGASALGDTGYVPRIVVLDKTGAIRFDDAGGVVNVEGLVSRVRPLL